MGLFTWPFEVGSLKGDRFQRVEGLVDTGATYSSVPGNILRNLGVEPTETMEFELADDSPIYRQLGDARVKVEGKEFLTTVIFGKRRFRSARQLHVGKGPHSR